MRGWRRPEGNSIDRVNDVLKKLVLAISAGNLIRSPMEKHSLIDRDERENLPSGSALTGAGMNCCSNNCDDCRASCA